ncbi:MAG: thymidine kinase [Gammaproteobacteria bacterium RIFCSPLOWO2_02_FULL_42_14]|nr:MAG: thymidine kinase [Gammaproteobacteria bacterium RIFCSPHIGHO2_02_FULL_42_43]OGT28491.1 MAG: thymidine kinase [Gammaproteobacteria bacterium RIFCSPHIGHO2_01_FULL_42_8]OGT51554.1 MAG: thymidine kinase [Gammaproteobacteria bacterium RIFCSPHIGHO2_12_FULL_41_25]OGT62253.1 MAG: thymidine kinase [Gammaproteobacteria bacterium RIFCSPLOWO2_02_FULL_42_14]OGT85927.1 MAG: thymidine kinase [Gammaproteobacteria bacterium RIFCSPLOWO2_12_FULL_42_18]
MAKLHFYYSAMNAGKSTTLLQSSYNYNERGMDTVLFTPIIDDRFGVGKIASRIGLEKEAIAIDKNFDIFSAVKKYVADNSNIKCVLIDEAQFLTKKQVEQLTHITDFLNLPVLAYGIRSDFQGEPFVGSIYLLAWADNIIELKTICHCGKKAIMNVRVNEQGEVVTEGEQIDIGGNEKYVATCRKHFRMRKV